MPKKDVTHYVALTKISEELDEFLLRDSKTKSVVLLGTGGSGKTQLALNFCRRFEEEPSSTTVIWIDASSQTSIAQSYNTIVSRMN